MATGRSTRVFVYGTLMAGERNHDLIAASDLLRRVRTGPFYQLVSFGSYPAMTRGGHTHVLGEVYRVDAATLSLLDVLEGHPDHYQRGLVALEDGDLVQAYLLRPEEALGYERILDGDWRSYVNAGGALAPPYTPMDDDDDGDAHLKNDSPQS